MGSGILRITPDDPEGYSGYATVEVGVQTVRLAGQHLYRHSIAVATLFPALSLPVPTAKWAAARPPGFNVALFAHQRETVALMLRRERQGQRLDLHISCPDECTLHVLRHCIIETPTPVATMSDAWSRPLRGGILADAAGLGKTISVIALHALNPLSPAHVDAFRRSSPANDERVLVKTTLVLCPAAIVGQWEREIRRAIPAAVVRVLRGANRDGNVNWAATDFAVTTYETAHDSRQMFDNVYVHRVVLDEIAAVGRVPAVVQAGLGAHTWLLSDTPLSPSAIPAGTVFPPNFERWKRNVDCVAISTTKAILGHVHPAFYDAD